MITREITAAETIFRVMVPEWAGAPTSGAGAALRGGRFNRPGTPAVYLSFDAQTALAEYKQDKPFLPPGTVASFSTTATVVDLESFLSSPAGWDPSWECWDCNWREVLFADHIEPPSWVLGDTVVAVGHHGIRFPSLRRSGGWNVVLFPGQFGPAQRLVCLDPDGLLTALRGQGT